MSGLYNAYEQLIILFAIMLIGYIFQKKNILKKEALRFLTYFVLYVSFPAITVLDMMLPMNKERMTNTIYLFLVSIVLYAVYMLTGRLTGHFLGRNKAEERMYEFATIFSNSGYMGLPIISALYGAEAVYYLMIYGIVYNFLFYSYGMRELDQGKQKSGKTIARAFLNIGFVATLIGLLLCVTGIQLPKVMTVFLEDLGNTTTPLSMIIVGAMVAELNLKDIFTEKKVYAFSFIRLVLLPLLTWGLIELTPLRANEWVVTIAVIVAAMPAASSTAMIAQKFGKGEKTATQIVIMTTILCCVTVPVFAFLISR